MEYYLNNLDATDFQRLVNAILTARYGMNIRITPLHGPDGGRDSETAPGNPYLTFELPIEQSGPGQLQPGRYIFQAKHHRTTDVHLSSARQAVITDFQDE